MKRKRELEIVCSEFSKLGIEVYPLMERAIANGLREVRKGKYEERMARKGCLNQTKSGVTVDELLSDEAEKGGTPP